VKPDSDKVFDTRAEAQSARDRLNASPPELGWSPWYMGAVDGQWWVVRSRGVMADDLEVPPWLYEERLRDAIRHSADDREYWRDTNGIEFQEVALDGSYPETRLVVVFRAVASSNIGFRLPAADCRFGRRTRIWPAEYASPDSEAGFYGVYLAEFLGTDPRAHVVRGARPCDPGTINWLS
jgi:hypothetical protein